ncbi:EF hand domain protein [Cordyceps fumosorosea ARSEF 2679]|uniref:EF hand domain protein n=1 Tax=Cordyceps fumosorosea (strain ARSEF 2679) TaxID=1081104 RepID=A0A167R271_CORFA|nr:EF hand domain protein [Cordyceps fumosorosea ARSEF 2679]OAA58201.1 EF hand domain protein [Cordyceps fumosorosea ARSEF 2679]
MSADAGPSSAAQPNLNLTPDEKRLYGQLFRQADTDGVGVVTGDVAVTFFDKTRLDSRVLGEVRAYHIWQIADKENRGFLTPTGFGIVLRLIGHAQAGSEPTPELALQPGPLPRFDGYAPPQVTSPITAQHSGSPAGARIPPLTPEKITQYRTLFDRQPLQGSLLPGEQARSIFDRSGLPNETLGRIWALVDTEQRGALSAPEFIVAMHLLTSTNSGALRTLPTVLPPTILEVAAGRGPGRQSPRTSNAGLPRLSGQQHRTASPLGPGPQPGSDWLVTSADKARFDQLYATLDKTSKGYITGEEAVPFLSQSNLSEDALAQIWDLADVNSQGQLNRDEFAVAMYLIRQQRLNPSTPLPTTLPPNLIPPSMRSQARQPPVAASPFDPPPMTKPAPPQPKSAMEDLFGLDTTPAPPAPRQDPMSTGGSGSDPFAGGPAIPSSPTRGGNTFKPFVPSSSFGRGLTGSPVTSQPPASEDLLADNNPEETRNISSESTELANLSNQISTLSTQMQDTQSKRTATQNDLNQTNTQKQNFQQRLAQLRTLYEKEAQDTRALEEQLRTSRAETQKLQGECMTLEGSLSDAQAQRQQVLSALQSDQQENTSLRERIRVANAELTQLKPQIEKLKMEARQQKGLVAINKKQLLTTEGERDKLKAEAADLSKAPSEQTSRGGESSSVTDAAAAGVTSPALSTASGNNPFFKRTASSDIMGVFSTPSGTDEIFGPSGAASGPAPAPFRPQTTGTSTASAGSYSTPPSGTPVMSRQTTLRVDNPPPPPESRQISSSFLPFGGQSESVSSSRQVSPPASRADGSVADGPAPTSKSTEEGSKEEDAKTPTAGDGKAIASPGKEKSAPFGDDKDKAKADFDNAFAAFTSAKSTTPADTAAAPKTKSASDTEFPPISEIERDEDSDSESEQGGFDDDFAPTSPGQAKTGQKAIAPVEEKTEKPAEVSKEEEPISPTTLPPTTTTHSSSVDDIFGPSASSTAAAAPVPAAQAKGVFDDLDDDFEGLEEAKEGSADDDFANISRSGFEDYNPMLDSPPASQARGEHSAFGNESSFDFIPSNPAGADSKAAESHDWDAIFSGLDSADPIGSTAADATKEEGKTTDRPAAVGRALTDKGEHDDPILKSLTGMGYARPDALAALEKYDYNLEMAANYLASKS